MKNNTASSINISEWKGQDIVSFQEDLQQKVKGNISEKSFYSYFKNTPKKLPRIDILNLLAKYCDFENWNDFKINHSPQSSKKGSKNKFSLQWIWIVCTFTAIIFIAYLFIPNENTFKFCFIDPDRNVPITKTPLTITILNNSESPFYIKSDSTGCFTWKTKDKFVHFIVQSPYHKTDTIYRTTSQKDLENIQVQTDDYALMLHYYANGKIEDWKNRKNELSKLIANDATIFQVLPYGLGIEVYEKNKFIELLTTPTESLKNIEIIASQKINGKIVKLKFKVKS
ncbi:hypothetical protein [Aquimarina algicola]|uniref:Uncharacterized protein n=1 Tax=Aquimarina algicola TaxID=2589995 RepID=A0A504ISD5_9FLAO|nr:hypothetical protein [Aquimarina algicola]TPN81387.1 hypothetical protein FHK87_25720 [Aquimarina algicola]